MTDQTDAAFLRDAAKYFDNQPTNGEDRAHWANVYNAMNCRRIADRLDAIDGKWAALPADAMLVLAALGNGESVPSAAGVSDDTGVPEARVKELHRALKTLGFAQSSPLMTDEGRTCGSGYFITTTGERFRKALATPPSPSPDMDKDMIA